MSSKTPKIYDHDLGIHMPIVFQPQNLTSAVSYIPEPSDVFISAYPKCGSTWTQSILYLMLNKGQGLMPGQNINEFIPHLEEVGKGVIEKLPKPRIIKTHLPYDLVPKSDKAKYIYLARNPKDNCVSYFYHSKGFGKRCGFEDGRFDDFYEAYMSGNVAFGDYFKSVLTWLPHKHDPNVLFLLYEELKLNAGGCIKKIGKFLGDPFYQSVEDPVILKNVLHNSSFNVMKSTPSYWSSENTVGFIRKGVIGDGKMHFSKEQSDRMDAKFKLLFSGTEAEHLWDDYDY